MQAVRQNLKHLLKGIWIIQHAKNLPATRHSEGKPSGWMEINISRVAMS